MSALSENTIKQVALGYLKSYYRLRPRAAGAATLTGMDLRGENDIIVDGFLKFIRPDNTPFMATFEATSNATKDEVHYRPRMAYVYWDGVVFACLTMAVVGAILHWSGFHPVVVYQPWPALGGIISAGFLLTFLYRRLFALLPRYRYITAVEQFKQYQAEDQWIAIGYDVFSTREEKRRQELIRQCTRYGFGLLEIDARREPRLVLAPSRAENFKARRGNIRLQTLQDWGQRMGKIAEPGLKRLRYWFLKGLGREPSRYFRWFPRTYYHQMALAGLGVLGIAFLYYQQYRLLPIRYVNEQAYNRRLARAAKGARPEISYFLIDAPVPGFDTSSNFEPFFRIQDEEQFSEIVQTEGSGHADSIYLPPVRIVVSQPGSRAALYYDCARFAQLDQAFYLITDTLQPNLTAARQRLAYFNDRGLMGTATWPYCLGGPQNGFLVYVDEVYLDSLEAAVARDSFQQRLDSLARPLRLRKFLPPPE